MENIRQDELGIADAETESLEDALGHNLASAVRKTLACSEEELAFVLERNMHYRCPGGNDELDDILASEILDDVVGKDDKRDIEAAQRSLRDQAREAAEVTRTVARIRRAARPSTSTSGKSSSSSSGKRKAVRFQSNAAWSLEDLQQLLPPFYRGYKDFYNKCWRIFHKAHRWSASRSWGPSGDDSRCCYKLLQMTWRRYLELNPGEACPYDFPPEI